MKLAKRLRKAVVLLALTAACGQASVIYTFVGTGFNIGPGTPLAFQSDGDRFHQSATERPIRTFLLRSTRLKHELWFDGVLRQSNRSGWFQ